MVCYDGPQQYHSKAGRAMIVGPYGSATDGDNLLFRGLEASSFRWPSARVPTSADTVFADLDSIAGRQNARSRLVLGTRIGLSLKRSEVCWSVNGHNAI